MTKPEALALTRQTETLEGGPKDGALLALLWPFLLPYRRWLVIAIASVLVTALSSLARPLIMLHTIDQSILTRDPAVIVRGGLMFLGVSVVEQLLGFAQIYSTQLMGAHAMADLRRHVFTFISRLPLGFFDRQPVGRIVTRVTSDVDAILELFNSGAVSALGDLIRLIGVVVIMLTIDWELSLVSFAALPLIGILVLWVRRRARETFRAIRGETARMNANMNEQVTGSALIRAYGREAAMFAHFDEINGAYRDANVRSIKYDAIQDAAIDAVSSISLASIIVALGYHQASFGTVVALTAYLAMFFDPISLLAQRYTLLQSALSGAERVFGLLQVSERDAPMASPGRPVDEVLRDEPAIVVDRVSFAYKPGYDVLDGVSFTAARGETVALVGPTGSGKTTITSLLLRLYEFDRGRIAVFGRDVHGLDRDQLRRQFGVVPQDVVLFAGTLAENVAIGESCDIERVQKVLGEMGVLDVFEKRPLGLECRVAPGGANFSQGERQLIALARALYRDAPILILDEATASVDSETEALMQRALERVLEGRTAIVVAHRLSTIRKANRIVVLQRGRVVESGSHAELLAGGGLYAALHRLQFARAEEGASVAAGPSPALPDGAPA